MSPNSPQPRKMRKNQPAGSAETSLLTVMANQQRLTILRVLEREEGELSVLEIAARTGLSQSALSHHLDKLHAAGVVTTRRDAQKAHYELCSDAVIAILDALDFSFGEGRKHPSRDDAGGREPTGRSR